MRSGLESGLISALKSGGREPHRLTLFELYSICRGSQAMNELNKVETRLHELESRIHELEAEREMLIAELEEMKITARVLKRMSNTDFVASILDPNKKEKVDLTKLTQADAAAQVLRTANQPLTAKAITQALIDGG